MKVSCLKLKKTVGLCTCIYIRIIEKINYNSNFLFGFSTATKILLFQGKMDKIVLNSKFKATTNCTINIRYAITASYFFCIFVYGSLRYHYSSVEFQSWSWDN